VGAVKKGDSINTLIKEAQVTVARQTDAVGIQKEKLQAAKQDLKALVAKKKAGKQ